jgi:hypothetical protein
MPTTSTLSVPCTISRKREAVKHFIALLEAELLEDIEERPQTAHSAEDVLGTIKKESFEVQMAVYKKHDSEFRRETFDLAKKVGRCWIDYNTQVLVISR